MGLGDGTWPQPPPNLPCRPPPRRARRPCSLLSTFLFPPLRAVSWRHRQTPVPFGTVTHYRAKKIGDCPLFRRHMDLAAPTTAAMDTPPGRGGIAVIVLRGPQAPRIAARTFRPLGSHAAGGEGVLQLGHVVDGEGVVDEAIVTWRDPREAEIAIHGGPAVTARVLDLLERLSGNGAALLPLPRCRRGRGRSGGFPHGLSPTGQLRHRCGTAGRTAAGPHARVASRPVAAVVRRIERTGTAGGGESGG